MSSLGQHVLHGLVLHRKWCKQTGVPFPRLLDELLVELAASSGQQRPNLGDLEPSSDPLLMDYDQVARKLAVSQRTVRRLVADGSLPGVRVGGRALVRLADLEAYVAGLRGAR
jgi:excisionase family DNA binding protein